MLNVDLMLGGSAFFSNLDDKSKAKFKARLLKRLNRKLGGESAAISLADIVISEENVLEIQKHTRNIVCFSWLGLAFGHSGQSIIGFPPPFSPLQRSSLLPGPCCWSIMLPI